MKSEQMVILNALLNGLEAASNKAIEHLDFSTDNSDLLIILLTITNAVEHVIALENKDV